QQVFLFFFFSSRRRHTRWPRDWSSDVCSSDLVPPHPQRARRIVAGVLVGVLLGALLTYEASFVGRFFQGNCAVGPIPLAVNGSRDRKSVVWERVELSGGDVVVKKKEIQIVDVQ